MSAAIYGSRAGLQVAMLEMGAPGGKLVKTNEISNWPGTIETNGAKLASDMFEHSTAFGAEYLYGNVIKVEDAGDYKKVICDDGEVYEAKAVIVATGTQERMMKIPGEAENIGRGVGYSMEHTLDYTVTLFSPSATPISGLCLLRLLLTSHSSLLLR